MARNDTDLESESGSRAKPSGPTPSQWKVIEALAAGKTVKDAANMAGVGRESVHRWLRNDVEFIAAHNQARQDVADSIRAEVRSLAQVAVKTVRKVMTSPKSAASARLNAALKILEMVNGLAPESAIGPTDAETIRQDRAKAERQWEQWSHLVDNAMPSKLTVPHWIFGEDTSVSESG